MRRTIGLLVFAQLLLTSPAWASHGAHGMLELLRVDIDGGKISPADAAMQRFYAVFEPELVAESYRGLGLPPSPSCATDVLAELRSRWDDLSGTQRHQVESASSPLYRQWLSDGGISWEQGDVEAARAAERSTCFGPGSAMPQGGPYNNTFDSEHFVIHYNNGGDVNESRVELLSGWFEEALEVESNEMGFYYPNNLSLYEILVMIEPLPPATGGFTSYAQCGLGDYMAFIVINDEWFDSNERLRSVAAHELFHTIQIEYARQEMWGNADSPNRWWIEASAVYMETEVYPTLYNSQLSQGLRWVQNPWRSLVTYDDTGYQYGTYLFASSVREELGESAWFHELWDQIFGRSGYDLLDEFDEVFGERDSSFLDQYGAFLERAATGDYEFNPYMPGPLSLGDMGGWASSSVTQEHDEDDLPVSEAINSSSGLDRPEYLGSNYIWFDGDGVDDDQALLIRFEGRGEYEGDTIEWIVRLVAVDDEEPALSHSLELRPIDEDGEITSWRGDILLNDFGEDFDGVFLVASPITDGEFSGLTWSYSAELTPSIADGSFSAVPEELLNVDEGLSGGCSCALAQDAGSGRFVRGHLAVLLGLLLLLRRRR